MICLVHCLKYLQELKDLYGFSTNALFYSRYVNNFIYNDRHSGTSTMGVQSTLIDFSSLHAYVHSTVSAIEYIHFAFLIGCVYLLYYITHVVHKPELYCTDKEGFKSRIKDCITELSIDQWPLIWCYSALPQTILHSVLGHTHNLNFKR